MARNFFHIKYKKTYFLLIGATLFLLWIGFEYRRNNSNYADLKVSLKETDVPCVEVEIENKLCLVAIDLGSCLDLELLSETLDDIPKTKSGKIRWGTFRGDILKRNLYEIQKVQLGPISLNKAKVSEVFQSDWDLTITNRGSGRNEGFAKPVGILGRGLLQRKNLLLDVNNSRLVVSDKWFNYKEIGYDLTSFNKIPFVLTSDGILLSVGTDIGDFKLLLDTGSSSTLLKKHFLPEGDENIGKKDGLRFIESKNFAISGFNYGRQQLQFISISESLKNFDGVLGMDFLKQFIVFVDFDRKNLYLKRVE